VKNILIVFVVLAIFWQVIYPKYQSYKYEKEAREYLKTTWVDETKREISSRQPQGLQIDFLNQYPNIRIYQKFLVDAVPIPELLDKQAFQKAWCSQLNGLTAMEATPRLAMLNVFEQDRVTFYLTIKDKFGKELFSFQQRISECPNFHKIRDAKQGDVIEDTKEVTFIPSAAPAAQSAPREQAASVQ